MFRYQVGDWVKFKSTVATPTYGWQGATHTSVGFVQSVPDKDNLFVSFCSGEARVLANEVMKVIPLDRGQHVQLKPDVREPRFDCNLICIRSNSYIQCTICNKFAILTGLGGGVNHERVLEPSSVLMMTGFCELGFLEHPEDGRRILQKWNGLKNSKLEIGSGSDPRLLQLNMG